MSFPLAIHPVCLLRSAVDDRVIGVEPSSADPATLRADTLLVFARRATSLADRCQSSFIGLLPGWSYRKRRTKEEQLELKGDKKSKVLCQWKMVR